MNFWKRTRNAPAPRVEDLQASALLQMAEALGESVRYQREDRAKRIEEEKKVGMEWSRQDRFREHGGTEVSPGIFDARTPTFSGYSPWLLAMGCHFAGATRVVIDSMERSSVYQVELGRKDGTIVSKRSIDADDFPIRFSIIHNPGLDLRFCGVGNEPYSFRIRCFMFSEKED